ncbi:hypothetical protein QT638_23260, partial [Xanthomonas citri pv. citri]
LQVGAPGSFPMFSRWTYIACWDRSSAERVYVLLALLRDMQIQDPSSFGKADHVVRITFYMRVPDPTVAFLKAIHSWAFKP